MRTWFDRERRAREQAARWVLRHQEDQGGDQDDAFARWLSEHPDHARFYRDCADLWRDDAVARALRAEPVTRPERVPLRTVFAAMALTGVMLGGIFSVAQLTAPIEPPLHFITEAGHNLSTRLADGSQIELNGDSEVTVSIDQSHRSMSLLRGQAFFDVSQDPARPLTISAGAAQVSVIGTAFDLQINGPEHEVELAVYRGRVAMAAKGRVAQFAEAGQRLTLVAGTVRRLSDFDPDAGDWRGGWLQTDDITLTQLVRQLNRIGSHPVEIASAKLGDLRIAGRLHIAEPDQLLDRLAAVHHFQVKRGGGKLVLTL